MKNVNLLILTLFLTSCSHTTKGDRALRNQSPSQAKSAEADPVSLAGMDMRTPTKLTIREGQSCFTRKFEGETVTGLGLTYEEAQMDLHKKIPSLGILQTINLEQKKMLVGGSYSESSFLKSQVSANIDNIMTQNCKINGLFAISAIIPEGSVNYLPKDITDISDITKEANFVNAKKMCGDGTYTIIVSMNDQFETSGGREVYHKKLHGIHKMVVCGSFKLKSTWFNSGYRDDIREIFANKYNLIYLGSMNNEVIEDYSKEFHLEMIKNAISSK